MKKINILTLVLLAITAFPGWGKVRNVMEQGRVSIVQDDFYLKGDSVHLEMTIAMNDVNMSKRGFVLLVPEIRNDTMNVSMHLPPVIINGKNRQKAYQRLVALHREPIDAGHVIDGSAKNASKTYHYSTVFAYEPWMCYAVFGVREDQCECNSSIMPVQFRFIAKGMEDRNPAEPGTVKEVELNYAVSFKVPNPEPVKNLSESGKAYMDFVAGRSELRPDFKNNVSDELIQRITSDPHTAITQVVIDGFASPEGSYATNMTLSERRAAALKDYLRTAYGLKESLFRVTGHGEDWDGLEELIEGSNKSYKEAALAIIRNTDVFAGRERKLMELQGGAPYREMLVEMFPKLRRSDYELRYTVIPFTVEQGRQTIETSPHLMSLNEMFLVAKSYPAESAEYSRVFNIAAQQFPDNDIANLNAAANALVTKNTVDAERYLNRISTHDAAWANNMGVTAALKGDFKQAVAHFESAKAAGNLEAEKNLAELDKLKEIK